MLPNFSKENIDVWSPQICSRCLPPCPHFIPWQLHLNIYVKMLVLAPSSASSDTSRSCQILHSIAAWWTNVDVTLPVLRKDDKQETAAEEAPVDVAAPVADETLADHVTTDNESDSEPEPVVKPVRYASHLVCPFGTRGWLRRKFRTVHLSLEGHTRALLCGRMVSHTRDKAQTPLPFDTLRCRQRFKSQLLEG